MLFIAHAQCLSRSNDTPAQSPIAQRREKRDRPRWQPNAVLESLDWFAAGARASAAMRR